MLLYKKGFNKIPNRILSTLIFVVICHLILISIDVKDLFLTYPHLSRLSWLIPVLYGPMILLLTQSITEINFKIKPGHLIYLIPFFTYLAILTPYFISSATEKTDILSDPVRLNKADFGWMNHLSVYIHITFVSIALLLFYKNKKKRFDFFSNETRINVRWLEEFLWLVLSIMIFSLFTFYARKYQIPYLSGIYPAHFILVVLLIYWIGYKLLQEKTVFSVLQPIRVEEPETPVTPVPAKYYKSGLSNDDTTIIAEKLLDLMTREKPFLNPNLTITELSGLVSLPKHQLSQVVNSEFGNNFFEFINQYRLQEFKHQAVNPANSHLSLLGIALECGFNSKATFNQVFKKYEGITPSEYVKRRKLEMAA